MVKSVEAQTNKQEDKKDVPGKKSHTLQCCLLIKMVLNLVSSRLYLELTDPLTHFRLYCSQTRGLTIAFLSENFTFRAEH